mmetsp:Transcript_22137/g.46294  ORF Transcript_22137/g.46294 Transcript_22137/m.46294 type:complete len:1330 (+) Transcript_22137:96-4085(+)
MDDVEEELRDLLAERDRYIDELEAELSAQEEDNDKNRDELRKFQDNVAELQVEIKQLHLDNKDLGRENTQLEDEVKTHKSQLDAQSSIIAVANKSSEDAKRRRKDGNQQLQRLELENQRLRATVHEIEENEDILVNEIDTLVRENSEYKEQSEEMSSKCDSLYADLDEKARAISQLVQEKEKAQNDLESERISVEEWKQKDAANRSEITRLLTELEHEKTKHKESAHVKENEAFRKELAKVRRESQKLQSSHDQCLRDKNQAERDLDCAIQALNEAKRNAREEIASVARKERTSLKEANLKLCAAQQKESTLRTRCFDAEEQREDLRKQLEQSEERNSSYENNNGLTEAIRCQKKLEADIRRRDYDLKRVNHTLGVEMEKGRVLKKAYGWLKEKVNLGQEFTFDDDEIKAALQSEDNRLISENAELSRQIDALEDERTKLLAQLRERAIEIGDRGVRFLGMSAQQISQVMEFASNLRNGITELPSNDRTRELMSEISNLKSDKDVDRVTINRLEREIFSLSEAANEPRGESLQLKQVAAENQQLRNDIDKLWVRESVNPESGSTLTRLIRQRAKELLGEDLTTMPAAAEVQFLCLLNEHDKLAQELALITKNIPKQETGEQPVCTNKDHTRSSKYESSTGVLLNSDLNADALALHDSQVEHFRQCTQVVNERNEKLTCVVSTMERAMDDLKKERDVLSAQLNQFGGEDAPGQVGLVSEVTKLSIKCDSLEEDLKKEKHARSNAQRVLAEIRANYENSIGSTVNMTVYTQENQYSQKQDDASEKNTHNEVGEHDATRTEVKTMYNELQRTQSMLSGYIDNVSRLRSSILTMQENRIDSAKVAMQISCLNDIIREKNRFIKEVKQKLAAAKKVNLELSRNKGFHEQKRSDCSISTNSIDHSILRATSNSGHNTPIRNRLVNATTLVLEKENLIANQNQIILELREKLSSADDAHQNLLKETESMKTDISTLVSRLAEAELDVNAIDTYRQKCDEVQNLFDSNKKEASSLKGKLSALSKEKVEKDATIKELQDSVARSKRVMTVARQGRARSEQNLKAASEKVTLLEDQLEKLGQETRTLKKEKIEAQNAKLNMSKKARLSACKLKDLMEQKGNSKTVEELEKRVKVLNKTVSGLASQNSKLRGELAAHKLLKKKADEEAVANTQPMPPVPVTRRGSTSRERPTSARAKSLENQVKSLQKSISQEKKHASDSSSMLDRYQKRIHALEQALQSTVGQNTGNDGVKDYSNSDELQQQILSLKTENRSLQQRVKEMKTNVNMESLMKQLRDENNALKKENERLSQVDHLDFFEEIEDLKYKYNEAVRQINHLTTG